jgi:seryl-tRNA synthetase
MLDIKFIRENREIVQMAIKNKKVLKEVDLDELLAVDDERKQLRKQIEELNQRKNQAAQARNIEEGSKIKAELGELEHKFQEIDKKFISLMVLLPNIPSADTPVGKDEEENKILRQVGDKPQFTFKPKEHWELGKALDIIDNERASEISGPRFTFLKGDLALMQFALVQHVFSLLTDEKILKQIAEDSMLDVIIKPFTAIVPPVFIKPAVMNRMARLEPREERYHIDSDDLYLIGSAEHTMGPMHMDETIEAQKLPIRYVGYSSSFRREAGSAGKDTRGILRMHQFDKVEMETFCLPENSIKEQEFLVAVQEHILKTLGLPYQVILVCTGDMGLPDHRQIDIETWMPGQDRYRETHSADLMTSYQSRRLNSRVKREDGKSEYLHMNDATAVAVGRTLIAIIENYQQEDGTIKIPEVLRKYMGGRELIGK